MDVSKILYAKNRNQWRSWLAKFHSTEKEIWLVYYKKNSGKFRISYNDAVEEALCYGWIDSTVKPGNEEYYLQRFSPRKKNSKLSELNKARVRQLIQSGKMTTAGLNSIAQHVKKNSARGVTLRGYSLPRDILKAVKRDPVVWKNFSSFTKRYKQIRVGWIDGVRNRPEVFRQRLNYFIKMTKKNKKFGMMQ